MSDDHEWERVLSIDGIDVSLDAYGIHGAHDPLIVRASCKACGKILSERSYTEAMWSGNPLGLGDRVSADAVKDATLAKRHICTTN